LLDVQVFAIFVEIQDRLNGKLWFGCSNYAHKFNMDS